MRMVVPIFNNNLFQRIYLHIIRYDQGMQNHTFNIVRLHQA